jgi:hypothetical protein
MNQKNPEREEKMAKLTTAKEKKNGDKGEARAVVIDGNDGGGSDGRRSVVSPRV